MGGSGFTATDLLIVYLITANCLLRLEKTSNSREILLLRNELLPARLHCLRFLPALQSQFRRLEWGFCAYEAYTPQPTEGVSPQTRAYLVNTFLRIQRHTAELVNIFKEYSLSL